MGLTQTQKTLIQKAKVKSPIRLSDEECLFVLATIVSDLGLRNEFPEFEQDIPGFFLNANRQAFCVRIPEFPMLAARLFALQPDSDAFFSCLCKLHTARLKFSEILSTQAIPTLDQVGPRVLLEFGRLSPRSLSILLFWRKWIYDVDGRAGQETGYLFEAILAQAIGGTPMSAKKSPVQRSNDSSKGRQVDCLKGEYAYEFKIRVTVAASGQGRWSEELAYPVDCAASGYTPVLVVLDPTPCDKLGELVQAFEDQNGLAFVGDAAWDHLYDAAGEVMCVFLEKYVHLPLRQLQEEQVEQPLPMIVFEDRGSELRVCIEEETYVIARSGELSNGPERDEMPGDVDEELPG